MMQANEQNVSAEPVLIQGNLFVDDRGELGFVNDFDMANVKRFYTVSNHSANFVRAWHAHKKESKYVTVVKGAAIVAAVKIDDWQKPSKEAKVFRFVLSAASPAVVFVPNGYANGFMTLTRDAKLMFFSTVGLEESRGDDFRFDAHYWDPWKVVER
jgi:dTDP-4-dehydrorhamnose 3,5-epimerase